ITSVIEFFTSYYLEFTTGTWPWKGYKNQIFNLGGRIALENSLGFGLISTIGLLFIQPKVKEWIKNMKYDLVYDIVYYILWALFVLDIIFAIFMPTGVRLDIVRTSWR
ncbi:MAG: putative ABC transporter permease, partial [Lachnospiraceae bacterium]|nr:putative ABC transporter permease [Lachnospiraceae bacterium]